MWYVVEPLPSGLGMVLFDLLANGSQVNLSSFSLYTQQISAEEVWGQTQLSPVHSDDEILLLRHFEVTLLHQQWQFRV